ncbi:DUF6629 family protein [Sphingomonas glacialis]|uniref:DUF6629 family protein n=1 Tax=Sphingomonas glacialis TaxID=658225 RepID=UPI0027E4A260|nr:DUF6629 family protein [Sphingomonas glacialis]
MCFYATASFTAGAGLLIIGAITVRRTRTTAELPFALIPAMFGVQQVIEGALWLTFPDKAPLLNVVLTYAYFVFSHVFWPIYVPFAVMLIEGTNWRRKTAMAIAVASDMAGLYLSYALITQPIVARVVGHHITYVSPHFYGVAVMALYLLGTCVSPLFSSHRMARAFGVAASISFVAAYIFFAMWFISV